MASKIVETQGGGHYCTDCFAEHVSESSPDTWKNRILDAGICGSCGAAVLTEAMRLADRVRTARFVLRCVSQPEMSEAYRRQGIEEPEQGFDGLNDDLLAAAELLDTINSD